MGAFPMLLGYHALLPDRSTSSAGALRAQRRLTDLPEQPSSGFLPPPGGGERRDVTGGGARAAAGC